MGSGSGGGMLIFCAGGAAGRMGTAGRGAVAVAPGAFSSRRMAENSADMNSQRAWAQEAWKQCSRGMRPGSHQRRKSRAPVAVVWRWAPGHVV